MTLIIWCAWSLFFFLTGTFVFYNVWATMTGSHCCREIEHEVWTSLYWAIWPLENKIILQNTRSMKRRQRWVLGLENAETFGFSFIWWENRRGGRRASLQQHLLAKWWTPKWQVTTALCLGLVSFWYCLFYLESHLNWSLSLSHPIGDSDLFFGLRQIT